MTDRVYLDWNASAPLRPEARDAMIAALDVTGNPSSVHAEGRATKAIVEKARDQVAQAVGCKPSEVVFTSGATEAASVLTSFSGSVDVDPTAHDSVQAYRGDGASIMALGLANSETGVVSGVPKTDGQLLLDVTQALGRIPFSFAWSGADFAICSAHKIGGPKGVGALIIREGLDVGTLVPGGGQEMGRRSGTENVAGIAGFGAAAEVSTKELADGIWNRVAELRNILESTLASSTKETIFVGQTLERLPNTSCFATPGWKGESQVMAMDLQGFAISAGSACSSGKVRESHVLRSMGYDEATARSAIRVSLGPSTTEEDITRFAQAWLRALEKRQQRAA